MLVLNAILIIILTIIGTNFTDRSRGFNLGLYVRFTDKAALDYYQPHPIHEEFKATVVEKEGTNGLESI